jgi:glycosyltransferase involved in cell wall biosynthesis
MKNIILISAVFPPEPVVSAKLSEDIANGLSVNNDVTVLAPIPSRPLGFQFNESINKNASYKLIHINSFKCPESKLFGRLRESYSFGIQCKKYITKNFKDIDVIYMNSWPLFSQFLITSGAKKFKIPIITHIQDIYPESITNKLPKLKYFLNRILLKIDKYILKNAKTIIAISEKMKEYLSSTRNVKKSKIIVVKNWQNEEEFISYNSSNIFNELSYLNFMYLGNIGPVAGVEITIEAFIKANIKNSKLTIAGSGSQKQQLQTLVSKHQYLNIEFLDVPDGMVPEIQSKASVMLLPIKKGAASSSIPSKLPAYMFSMKPIIASVDIDSDTARVINEANCGWVVNPEDSNALATKMKDVAILDKNNLSFLGLNGYNYAIEHLSKKSNLHKILKIIEDSNS